MPKTMILKLEVMQIEPISILDISKYPSGDGMYLVNDGIAHLIVVVFAGIASSVRIPNTQILDEYTRKAKGDAARCERDVLSDLERKIKVFETVLGESLVGIADAISKISNKKQDSNIDLAGLTKLIAVAQKPDLVKGK